MVNLTTISNKQNIYILGTILDQIKTIDSVFLTDDYCSVGITNGIKTSYIETDGSFYIVTEEEFLKNQETLIDNFGSDIGYFKIQNFIGNLNLKIMTSNGKDVLNKDFDRDDLLLYELSDFIDEDDYYDDALVVIDSDFSFETHSF